MDCFRTTFGGAPLQGGDWTAGSTGDGGILEPGLRMGFFTFPENEHGGFSLAGGPVGGVGLGIQGQPHLFGSGDPDGPVVSQAEPPSSPMMSIEEVQTPQTEEREGHDDQQRHHRQHRQSLADDSLRLQRLEEDNRRLEDMVRQMQERLYRLENPSPPLERLPSADFLSSE